MVTEGEGNNLLSYLRLNEEISVTRARLRKSVAYHCKHHERIKKKRNGPTDTISNDVMSSPGINRRVKS